MICKIAFGGGCHWCTEAVFQVLHGVLQVDQGWAQSTPPHHSFSEAALVTFDSKIISLSILVEVHLLTHSSTSNHPLRRKFRSAIYHNSTATRDHIRQIIDDLKRLNQKNYITQVLTLNNFKGNIEEYQNYYLKKPQAPFCQNYIDPKLNVIRSRYKKYTK